MAGIVLLLYVKEEGYGRRLLHFLLGKRQPGLHPELVTEKKMLMQRAGTSGEQIVILTDDAGVQEDEKRKVILLAGEQDRERQKIFQYQCGEGIYQELVAQLGLKEVPQQPMEEKKKIKGVIMLFSTEGSGVTVTAVMLSQYLGRQGKCLYLCLSAFPVFYCGELRKEPPFETPGLEELLFDSEHELSQEKIGQLIQKFGYADILAPMCHFKDILDCSMEDWQRLLDCICREGGYDTVVVELGQIFESVMEFLELGDHVWLLRRRNTLGEIRDDVFRHYCHMEKKEELLDRTEFIPIPERWEEWEEQLCIQSLAEWGSNAQMMQEIENLWEREKEEEENVCIWEDLG